MKKDKVLLESHSIASKHKVKVQLSKRRAAATTAKGTTTTVTVPKITQPVKFKSQLNLNGNILISAPKPKQTERGRNKSQGKCDGIPITKCKSDKELLISNGITSHIRIRIAKQEVPLLINTFEPIKSNELSSKKRKRPVKKLYYKCPICPSYVELSSGSLLKHTGANHKSKNVLKCSFPKCVFSTSVPYFLKNHFPRVHQPIPFHCSVCFKNFKKHPHLKRHMLSHSIAECNKKYICPRLYCEFLSHYANNLKTHASIHDPGAQQVQMYNTRLESQ